MKLNKPTMQYIRTLIEDKANAANIIKSIIKDFFNITNIIALFVKTIYKHRIYICWKYIRCKL